MQIRVLRFLVLPLFLLLSFSACELRVDSETKTDEGAFWAYNIQLDSYYQVTASKVYEGEHCIIYREDGEENYLSDSLAVTLGQEFDNNINDKIINSFGNPSDVDDNGKIVLLALDIRDGWSGGGYVAGYFDHTNTYSANTYSRSNEKDMLYLDTYPGLLGADTSTFRETMAHEYQHLINYYQKVFVQNVGEFDLWINEGMSSAAEKIYAGAQITSKIQQYSDGIGGIENGRNFISWTGDLDSYATVYLFFQWLGLQSSQGDAVYKTIMSQTATDYSAVQNVAQSTFTTTAPGTFSGLLGAWFVANYVKDSTGLYGYKGNAAFASLNPPRYSGTSVSLDSGEGVYKTISAGVSPSGSSPLVFMGVTAAGAIDTTAPYSGDVLIAYNGNGDTDGTSSSVSGLPASVADAGTAASLASKDVRPDRYRIDVQFGPDGRPYLPGKAAR